MATIHDVAKLAGVAPITVSRVINNSGYVSDITREKVQAAISELDYVPNILARSLRSKRTNTLALVFTDITNPFFWNSACSGKQQYQINKGDPGAGHTARDRRSACFKPECGCCSR